MRRRDRVAGGLLGVHAGDALGATVEFAPWADIRARYPDGVRNIVGGGPFGWPPGHATDDTDLTRAVLLAYLSPGPDVVRACADNMVAWLRGDWPDRQPGTQPRDIGGATHTGLRRYLQTADPRAAGAGPGRAGNGSLMRCLPTALAVDDQDRRIRESMEISAITHDDPAVQVLHLDFSASTCPTGPVAEARAMEPSVATLWGEPAASAAASSVTAPYAAVRRVSLSWSVRVMDGCAPLMERTDGASTVRPPSPQRRPERIRRDDRTSSTAPDCGEGSAKTTCAHT